MSLWPRTPSLRRLAALLTVLAAFAYPLRLPVGAMLGEAGCAPAMPVHQHGTAPHPLPDHAADHRAHCLFCLTGAFATAPAPEGSLAGLVLRPVRERAPLPRAARTRLPLPEARAPPRPG
ncbi:hypothetical protein Dcar01_00886 [Deinococcus carri]|uniref:DUF2946 domain-containing protein n=1 Tax=Deinococcus carri TaxID=1211323 RepID=A0ABP9W482_9DEIO